MWCKVGTCYKKKSVFTNQNLLLVNSLRLFIFIILDRFIPSKTLQIDKISYFEVILEEIKNVFQLDKFKQRGLFWYSY